MHSFNESFGVLPHARQFINKKNRAHLLPSEESQAGGRTPFPSQTGPQDITREVQWWWKAWVPKQLREEASEAGGPWWSRVSAPARVPGIGAPGALPHQPPWPLRSRTVVTWGLGSHYSEYLSAEWGKETKSPSLPLPHLYRWLFVALTSSFKWVHRFYFPTGVKKRHPAMSWKSGWHSWGRVSLQRQSLSNIKSIWNIKI